MFKKETTVDLNNNWQFIENEHLKLKIIIKGHVVAK